jgi:hypothetical protein
MDGQIDGVIEQTEEKTEDLLDPWAAAFAALDPPAPEAAAEDDTGDGAPAPEPVDGGDAAPVDTGDGAPASPDVPDTTRLTEEAAQQTVKAFEDNLKEYHESLRQTTIGTLTKHFIDNGIRNRDGIIGARIDDADITKYDKDGVPHYFNPDTGKEFRGENPRRQAKEWVEDYNEELKENFNRQAADYFRQLQQAPEYRARLQQHQASVELLKWAPRFDALSPEAQQILNDLIEDSTITDKDGKPIGFDCDLAKAFAQAERIAARTAPGRKDGAKVPDAPDVPVATSPALDMPTGATSPGERPQFSSIAEALEWQQDQLLQQRQAKKGR